MIPSHRTPCTTRPTVQTCRPTLSQHSQPFRQCLPAEPWAWKLSAVLVASCLTFATSGCSSGTVAAPPEDLVSVNGSVRIAGQPTGGIRITFTPKGATGGNGGFALTDESGHFEVIHTRTNQPGMTAGEYVATFSKFLLPDGSALPPNTSPFAGGAKESIPAKWSEPAKAGSHNTVTVADGKPVDFAIPKK
jgi:hypothetical protein